MPVCDASGRARASLTRVRGMRSTWPVQPNTSAVSMPSGVPSM